MKSIKEAVQDSVKEAMRAKDKERLGVLRLILAEFKRIEVDERIELDPTRELAILDKMQKQRREAIAQFKAGNRDELAEKEQVEFDIIQSFKPQPLDDAEVENLIQGAINDLGAASIKDMGKVMATLKPKLQGRADMSVVSSKIKELLST